MGRSKRIRKWMTDNPGWHFAGDVGDALGAHGHERTRVSQQLWQMGNYGVVERKGEPGSMRYRILVPLHAD